MEKSADQQAAVEQLMPLVYEELRQVAKSYFRKQRPGFTLHPTELVNEACVHLLQKPPAKWSDSEHFRAIATRKIWQVVVDHVRHRKAHKRGGSAQEDSIAAKEWQKVPLESVMIEWHDRPIELLDLAEALEDLSEYHSRLHEVVVLHWFGGLTYADTARLLNVSASTAEKDFRFAMAWLSRRLESSPGVH